jgi:hypothetical protein
MNVGWANKYVNNKTLKENNDIANSISHGIWNASATFWINSLWYSVSESVMRGTTLATVHWQNILGTNKAYIINRPRTLSTSCLSCCGSMQVSILSSRSMIADVPMCLITKSTKSSRFRRNSTIWKTMHAHKHTWIEQQ